MSITERGIECPNGNVIFSNPQYPQGVLPKQFIDLLDKKLSKFCSEKCKYRCMCEVTSSQEVELQLQSSMIKDLSGDKNIKTLEED